MQRLKPRDVSTNDSPNRLLNDTELGRLLGVSKSTLAKWRSAKTGPPFLKVGYMVRYHLGDALAYMKTFPRGGAKSRKVA